MQEQYSVGIYARLSRDDERAGESVSIENQKEMLARYVREQGWTLYDYYCDEGISGTRADKRPQFQKMINDCLSGKIDYIITKSVSRFARNTVDCLDHVRMLRARGIGIYFEEQNIDTLQIDSELYLVIYAGFAQSESESISKNVTWTFRKRFQEGKPISAFLDTARVQTENRRSSRRRHPSWRGSSICTCQVKPSTGSQPNSEKKISRYQENVSPSLRA